MWYEFFQVLSDDSGPEGERLNQFLKTHRIVKVEKQFFTDGANGYWSFCVSWLEGDSHTPKAKGDTRVDYREVLTEQQFTVYSALRELRKQLADKEGIPMYAVSTNEQLAQMVQRNPDSMTSLKNIPGFGKTKAERYGERFLGLLRERMGNAAVDNPPKE